MNIFFIFLFVASAQADSLCRYTFTRWNAHTRTAEGPFKVQKLKSDLTTSERGFDGCSVCEDDQEDVTLSNGVKFRACKKMAMKFRTALERSLSSGKKLSV